MKPPLNNETKARLYYTYGVVEPYERNFPIPLKPLSSISDEDAIEVWKMATLQGRDNGDILSPIKWVNHGTERGDGDQLSFHVTCDHCGGGRTTQLVIIVPFNGFMVSRRVFSDHSVQHGAYSVGLIIDFLRSRGYLLPWMGLSCKEIIEAGWAKYVEG